MNNNEELSKEEEKALEKMMSLKSVNEAFEEECKRCPVDVRANETSRMIAHGFFMAGHTRAVKSLIDVADGSV